MLLIEVTFDELLYCKVVILHASVHEHVFHNGPAACFVLKQIAFGLSRSCIKLFLNVWTNVALFTHTVISIESSQRAQFLMVKYYFA